ncbi:cytochrome c biogenesis protein [Humisphaera borealis]|uniref:Cytochrome c biogenesis protein CcsA n=1 Tax=Humisphaera borealis TaxID=2807512 RepID=A0A7M2WW37_9BACT|nr:cytochrome c biogenesis protein CcsA [Humisphaera borealis]QOV88710.1 cytochrome c biogenesis protein CcsA [Humisphaera borealis]
MKVLKSIATALASLKITVVLLSLAIVLVFAGTLAQREDGIWQVVRDYFRCWVAFIPIKHLIPFADPAKIPGTIMFPGGYTIIVAILINLLCAHAMRFKFVRGDLLLVPLLAVSIPVVYLTQNNPNALNITLASLVGLGVLVLTCLLHKKRAGVIIIHFSLILLLLGEGVTGYLAKEGQMPITEGQAANWVQDIRAVELAVVDTSDPKVDKHVVIGGERLAKGGVIQDPRLPFDIRIDRFHWNSEALGPQQPQAQGNMLATAGAGKNLGIIGKPRVNGIDPNEVDVSAAFVTPVEKGGNALGTYLVTLPVWADGMLSKLNEPQAVEAGGKTYQMQLRFERGFRPFAIHLHKFTHDKFEGTAMARNFASQVTLLDPAKGVSREVTIKMNEPLRYAGETFFQASFRGDKTTILQVVKNPGWLMPYIACGLGALGMLIHFGIHLVGFLGKRSKAPPPGFALPPAPPKEPKRGKGNKSPDGGYSLAPVGSWPQASKWLPIGLAVFAAWYVIGHAFQGDYKSKQTPANRMNLTAFAEVPVSFDGRVMPIDSVARGNLKILSGRESIKLDDGGFMGMGATKIEAVEWFADTLAGNARSDTYKVFRIDHPEVKSLLGLKTEEKLFSWEDIAGKPGNMSKFQEQVTQVRKVADKQRDPYQQAVVKLYQHISRYIRLVNATEQSVLNDVLADERKGVELLVAALRAGVFVSPDVRSEAQHKAIFGNQLLRQLDRTVNYLGSEGGATDNLLFIAPLADGQKWQPLARVTVRQLRTTLGNVRNVLVHEPDKADIVAHFDEVEATLAEREAELGHNVEMPATQMESATAWFGMLRQLRNEDVSGFDASVASYINTVQAQAPKSASHQKAGFEMGFNRFDPFTVSLVFYIAVLVMSLGSMIGFTRPLWRSAIVLLSIALVVHSYGLIARMYISGRPPVTNLYSSAVFIGFGAALICLILEAIFRNGVSALTAAVLGIATTLIAGALDVRDVDTMAQLQAVLDTNWWLATHVVVITKGYTATFIAGIVAIVFIIRGLFTKELDSNLRKELYRMCYGIVCFAMFASFVGTILGGIWADQSWGRFWGWDPKENGAILIVLWNAVILHARWGGIVKERGFMVLCVVGIIITGWSWFGTNLMGIGLHAYGFIDGGVLALLLSWAVSGLIIVGGMMPKSLWRSYAAEAAIPTANIVPKPPKLPAATVG